MKKVYKALLHITATAVFVNICLGGAYQSAEAYLDKICLIEELWTEGQVEEYYQQALAITEDISKEPMNNDIRNTAEALLRGLLEKSGATQRSHAEDDIWAVQQMAEYLSRHVPQTDAGSKLIIDSLGYIRSSMIPNYVFQPVAANVAPPIVGGAGLRFAGMNPEYIDDPVARTQYEAAIRANNENDAINRRQHALEIVSKQLGPTVVSVICTYYASDVTWEKLNTIMDAAKLNETEREQVINRKGVGPIK